MATVASLFVHAAPAMQEDAEGAACALKGALPRSFSEGGFESSRPDHFPNIYSGPAFLPTPNNRRPVVLPGERRVGPDLI
jgi:hypothetical protein